MTQRRFSRGLLLLPFALLILFMVVGNLRNRSTTDSEQDPEVAFPLHVSEPMIALSPKEAQDFDRALASLTRQAGVLIVAEGVPLHPRLPLSEIKRMAQKQNATSAVRAFADAFDYSVSIPRAEGGNNTVFLLKKRYSDPQDIPAVTLDEYWLAVRDIQSLMKPYVPKPSIRSSGDLIQNFTQTLSPEQVSLLEKGELKTATLSEAQKSQVYAVLLDNRMSRVLRDVNGMTERLSGVRGNTLGFGHLFNGERMIGIYQKDKNRRESFQPFYETRLFGKQPKAMRAVPPVSSHGQTLEMVAKRLGGDACKVDPALAEKPISIGGEKNVPATKALESVAEVYGLTVVNESANGGGQSARITRRPVRTPGDVNELKKCIYAALPEPMLRAAQRGSANDMPIPGNAQQRSQYAAQRVYNYIERHQRDQGKRGGALGSRISPASLKGEENFALGALLVGGVFRYKDNGSSYQLDMSPLIAHWQETTLSGGQIRTISDPLQFQLRIKYEEVHQGGGRSSYSVGGSYVLHERHPAPIAPKIL